MAFLNYILLTHFLRSTNYFNMEEIKQLSDDVLEQIKDFPRWYSELSKEQKSLINKLIPDEELKECYRKRGLCKECKQPKYNNRWCQDRKSTRLNSSHER